MAELVELALCRSKMEAVELIIEGLGIKPDPCPKPHDLRAEIRIRVAMHMDGWLFLDFRGVALRRRAPFLTFNQFGADGHHDSTSSRIRW